MNYSIVKALTAQRWDLMVNGIAVECEGTRWELITYVINPLVSRGFLLKEVPNA